LGDVFLLSKDFIDLCLQKFQEHIREEARKQALSQSASLSNSTTSLTTSVELKGSAKKNAPPQDELGESQGKGKGARSKRGKQQQQKQPQASKKGKKEPEEEPMSNEAQLLTTWFGVEKISDSRRKKSEFQDSDSQASQSQMFSLLAAKLAPKIEAMRKAEESTMKQTNASLQRAQLKLFQQKFDVIYLNLLLFQEGIKEIDDVSLCSSLETYLLETVGAQLYAHILEGQAIAHCIEFDETEGIPPQNRKAVLDQLPKPIQSSLAALERTIMLKKLSGYMTALGTVVEKCDLHCRELDKKMHKNSPCHTQRGSAATSPS